jgi:hypothetical protein
MENSTFDDAYVWDINDIWIHDLIEEFHNINVLVHRALGKRLKVPEFCIDWEMGKKWGEWNPTTRTTRLNAVLFRDYEWAAVVRVLKHEVGHQIVSEIFDQDQHGCVHGEFWKLACQAVGLDNITRCDSGDFLAGLKGSSEETSVTRKIKACLAKGRDAAATPAEVELFLAKAQELMMKNSITESDLYKSQVVWNKRPLGECYERWPSWMSEMGHILDEYYNVRRIRACKYIKGRKVYYMEIYGTTDNLNMAEYVFYAILNNAQHLYDQALNEHKRKMQEDECYKERHSDWYDGRAKRFTFTSFMEGLLNEFSNKLFTEKQNVEGEMTPDDLAKYALVSTENEKLLDEMHSKQYPNLRFFRTARSTGIGRVAGRSAGRSLNIGKPVSSGRSQKLIGA